MVTELILKILAYIPQLWLHACSYDIGSEWIFQTVEVFLNKSMI